LDQYERNGASEVVEHREHGLIAAEITRKSDQPSDHGVDERLSFAIR
jgi:hypothetical protein